MRPIRVGRLLVIVGLVLGQAVTLVPSSSASVVCRFDRAAARMHVDASMGDGDITLRREDGGDRILVIGYPCQDATVFDVDRIVVRGGPGYQTLTIDLSGGWLGPGRTREQRTRISEIEIMFEGRLGTDFVHILGGPSGDRIALGTAGAAIGRDGDTDYRWWSVGGASAAGSYGDDHLRTMSPHPPYLYGGPGDDVMVGSSGPDVMDGGPGIDLMAGLGGNDGLGGGGGVDSVRGRDGNDRLSGGQGPDEVFGGRGDDRLFLRDGTQELAASCGRGSDVIRNADPEDLDVAAGCERLPTI